MPPTQTLAPPKRSDHDKTAPSRVGDRHVFSNTPGQWITGGVLAAVLTAVALVYHFIRLNPATLFTANKCLGIGAAWTIAMALVLGPMNRLAGGRLAGWLPLRRTLGVIGVALTVPHILLSIFWFPEKFPLAWYAARWHSIVLASLSEIVLIVLVVYSWPRGFRQLGPSNWRRLHQCGWLALALVLGHILLLGKMAGWIKWFETYDRYLPPGALAASIPLAAVMAIKLLEVVLLRKRKEVLP